MSSLSACLNRSLRFLIACFAIAYIRMPACSQPEAQEAKLAIRVHLRLGPTTLEKVAAALSQQTGLAINAASYLREHKLIVQMDNLPAQDALDALAALNEWIWYKTEPGHYLITRPRVRLPREIAEIPPALYKAMPIEMRRYAGFGVSVEELSPIADPQMRQELEALKQQGTYELMAPQASVGAKMDSLRLKQQNLLVEVLKPDPFDGKITPYSRLTPEQKQALLIFFVSNALESAIAQPRSLAFSGRLLPFQRDIRKADIVMTAENCLQIGTFFSDEQGRHFVGFFGEIKSDQNSLEPIPQGSR
ncbi:MAG TPA: hypothetical protein VFB38_20625 [Chthonomonadaceae bacterium]|nr:hypothetical protein [Chthonomonadaceae bacterium]